MKITKRDFLIPITFLLLGAFSSFVLSMFEDVSLIDGTILSIVLSLSATLIDQELATKDYAASHNKLSNGLHTKLDTIITMLTYNQNLQQVKHPYFEKCIRETVDEFLKNNQDLFNGTKITSPHSDDTFGIEGITYTKNSGTIKAVSSITDYWDDNFAKLYIDTQQELINSKNVTIQRIFLLSRDELQSKRTLLEEQYKCGIKVYYILTDSPFIDPSWHNEDFLIQDDELIVEIQCTSHKYQDSGNACEKITVSPLEVQRKIARFDRMLERSTEYMP